MNRPAIQQSNPQTSAAAYAIQVRKPEASESGTGQKVDALSLTRANVRDMLLRSPAFLALPQAQQRQIAHDTVNVANYLAAPEGLVLPAPPVSLDSATNARALEDMPEDRQRKDNFKAVSAIAEDGFQAGAAREGAAVAGALLKAVNFPKFVAGLIQGVFHAIVESSIEQMEAYGRLIADVAKTLNQFRDENVSANQGRDHLMSQFPDMFQMTTQPSETGEIQPCLSLREGVDEEAALRKVNGSLPIEGGPLSSLDEETIEEKLVMAARTQLATGRQQLLATMVMMGINRIVVTEGKIHAKVLYDFQARDNRRFARSATAYDYARTRYGNLQTTWSGESTYESESKGTERTASQSGNSYDPEERGGSYYAKGEYKYEQKPVMTAMSTASEQSDAALQTKASLAGVVEVNFKSDYLPLERMADPSMIAQIQMNAQPGMVKSLADARRAGTPTGSGIGGTQASGASATQPAK